MECISKKATKFTTQSHRVCATFWFGGMLLDWFLRVWGPDRFAVFAITDFPRLLGLLRNVEHVAVPLFPFPLPLRYPLPLPLVLCHVIAVFLAGAAIVESLCTLSLCEKVLNLFSNNISSRAFRCKNFYLCLKLFKAFEFRIERSFYYIITFYDILRTVAITFIITLNTTTW